MAYRKLKMSTKKRALVHAVQAPWIRVLQKGLASAAFFNSVYIIYLATSPVNRAQKKRTSHILACPLSPVWHANGGAMNETECDIMPDNVHDNR